jgi:hypothetical protein
MNQRKVMHQFILFSLIFLLAACGDSADLAVTDLQDIPQAQAQPTPDSDPGPTPTPLGENSEGVEMVTSDDGLMVKVIIPAKKEYGPSKWSDGLLHIPQVASLVLPEKVSVTNGRPGNHLAYVKVMRASLANGLPQNLRCVYVGEGNNTPNEYASPSKNYSFDFCLEESIDINPGNRNALRNSVENILNQSDRPNIAISLERADQIILNINNGNHKSKVEKNITTAGQVNLLLEY